MKYYSKKDFEERRPEVNARQAIEHCLERYVDNVHIVEEEISKNLTYEEVIGALLMGRDDLDKLEEYGEDDNLETIYADHKRDDLDKLEEYGEDDNLETIYADHKRYVLGDQHPTQEELDEIMEYI